MQKRNTQQRRRAIIDLLTDQGEVQVEQLASHFSTSEVTIRKDLAALEDNGLLLRKFGGAVPMPKEASELADAALSKRKQAIGALAATLIGDHQRIIIDSGSTTASLLPHLNHKRGLVVMTNSLQVANSLLELENEPHLLMTGGTWDKQSHSFQGQMAEQILSAYNFDMAFMGAAGLDLDKGTTTFNELTQLTQSMAKVASKVVVMAESEKLQRRIPNIELAWSQIDVLITDDQLDDDSRARIEQHGVVVMCAPHQQGAGGTN